MPEKGVYVDVGCYHPKIASNTAHFRELGWSGVAIDANPHMAKEWADYPGVFVNALIGNGEPAKYQVNYDQPGWSRVGSGEVTPTRTLESILSERGIGKIDLLSIDLEGQEFAALQSLDLEKHQPQIIIAEFDTGGMGKDFRVLEYLLQREYIAMHMTEANIIYRRTVKQENPKR